MAMWCVLRALEASESQVNLALARIIPFSGLYFTSQNVFVSPHTLSTSFPFIDYTDIEKYTKYFRIIFEDKSPLFKIDFFYFLIICMCGGCVCVHTIALLWATDLGMELQGVIRHFMCVLGTDLSSSRD